MRIDWFRPGNTPTAPRRLFVLRSHRDMMQLTKRCIDYPDYHFASVPGVLGNARNRQDKTYGSSAMPRYDARRSAVQIAVTGAGRGWA
jgi:uronate dehydrogenase